MAFPGSCTSTRRGPVSRTTHRNLVPAARSSRIFSSSLRSSWPTSAYSIASSGAPFTHPVDKRSPRRDGCRRSRAESMKTRRVECASSLPMSRGLEQLDHPGFVFTIRIHEPFETELLHHLGCELPPKIARVGGEPSPYLVRSVALLHSPDVPLDLPR